MDLSYCVSCGTIPVADQEDQEEIVGSFLEPTKGFLRSGVISGGRVGTFNNEFLALSKSCSSICSSEVLMDSMLVSRFSLFSGSIRSRLHNVCKGF